VKVTYLSTLPDGGPVSHLLDLAPRVAAHGVEVGAVCASAQVADALRARGVAAVVAPVRSRWDLRGGAAATRALRGADVVHTHDRRALLVGGWATRRLRVPLVHTCHGVPEDLADRLGRAHSPHATAEPLPSRARLRAEAWLGRRATWVVPSRAMAEFLAAHGLAPARIRVLPSGIDRRRDDPGPRHAPFAVGTAARLAAHKGVDVLVAACAVSGVPLRLHVFGEGPQRGALQEQAERLGVDAVFAGHVDDVRARLEDLDLFVLPSRGDNLPVSILEAMAAALPVVATRVGGIPELVADGSTGVVVEPGDITAMAAAIAGLAADEERRRCLGRAGAARVDRDFSADGAGRAMADLYERVCASST
jgi:glycosyltransferase involved in cell wall biosynthesis